jgi:hypothetical protein
VASVQTKLIPLPGGGAELVITISKKDFGAAAEHIEEAINDGKPKTLTPGGDSKANRRESLKDVDPVKGKDRDEYPMAMFKEGGAGASVKPIDPSSNRSLGSSIGNAVRNNPSATQVTFNVVP